MPSRCCLLLGCFLALCSLRAFASVPQPATQDLWYSIYFQGQHSGYTHITSGPDVYQGRKATLDRSSTITTITVFGTIVEQDVESTSWSDPRTGAPFFQTFKIQSGGTETDVEATFTSDAVTAVLKSGTDQTTKVVPIPPGEKIIDGDIEEMNSSKPLAVGQTETDVEFDPLTLTLETQTSKVLAVGIPVKDALDGLVRSTAKIDVHDAEGGATAYQDGTGTPLRILMPAGICMVSCTKDAALSSDNNLSAYAEDPSASLVSGSRNYQPAPDLAVSTSVSPEGKAMVNERTMTSLMVKLMLPGKPDKVVSEKAVAVPPSSDDPISTLSNIETDPYLSDAPYLSLDSASIKNTAAQIVGTQTDSYLAVKALHDWVYAHMSPKGSLGVPRAASDIIANPVGVCRDYAILYTSLARDAGIPTKVSAGLVGYQGKFYYHAWASSYIGGSVGWLPVDATMPTMFVDASHIALGSGDPTVMFALADVIGNMRVETLTTTN